MCLSPDGKTLAFSHDENTVKLWDLAARKERSVFRVPGGAMQHLALSPDGRFLAYTGFDSVKRQTREARLWDLETGQETQLFIAPAAAVQCVAFSPLDGTLVIGDGYGLYANLRCWNVAAGRELPPPRSFREGADSVAFSRDGALLATGRGGALTLWDARRWKPQTSWRGNSGTTCGMAFSPDGRTLAVAANDCTVKLWHVATQRELAVFRGESTVWSVAFSPNGKSLAAGDSLAVRLWHAAEDDRAAVVRCGETVVAAAVSPDGKWLVAGGGAWEGPGELGVWDLATGRLHPRLEAHTGPVLSVAFSPDGTQMASGSHDETVRLWDTGDWTQTGVLRGAGADILSLAFSPDGSKLAAGTGGYFDDSPGSVRFWDLATAEMTTVLPAHTGSIRGAAFSPDGKTLAAVTSTPGTPADLGEIRLWEIPSLQERRAFKDRRFDSFGFRCVVFSRDSATLATGCTDHALRFWDVATGKEEAALRGHLGPIVGAASSPDGRLLATASFDGTARLWDWSKREDVRSLQGHVAPVFAVAFFPDGNRLVTGGGTMLFWPLLRGELKVWDLRRTAISW